MQVIEDKTYIDLTTSQENKLLASVTCLRGVGHQLASKLAKLNITTVLDLLLHLPYKYQDRTRITQISALQVNTHAVIEAKVFESKVVAFKNSKRNLTLYAEDASGVIELKFFQFNNAQLQQFKQCPIIRCFGEVKYGKRSYAMFHPEYELINDQFIKPVEENLRPVYPSTEGITQKRWLMLIDLALDYLDENILGKNIVDYLPIQLTTKYHLQDFASSIKQIHKPTPEMRLTDLDSGVPKSHERLIFEELVANQLAMRLAKQHYSKYRGYEFSNTELVEDLIKLLPFGLTDAQQRVSREISNDMKSGLPMSRLLQGDVGAGKTVIAAIALLQAVGSGFQAALMAPTEILATQHYLNLKKYFDELNISVELLLSKQTKKQKTQCKQDIKNNRLSILIGTHALIQDDVEFNNLGLIIIDEQHRFGVEQRNSLWQKGFNNNYAAHQLTMTATPIPRTLAMTLYSDMDYSVIDQLPPGRKQVKTVVMSDKMRDQVIERIKTVCEQGRQVYWVCTLIEESEALTCKAAEDSYQYLNELLTPLKVGLIHGRLKQDEKNSIMDKFKSNDIQVLVATTVIEVGVDVPNASLMIIENPERLGLSQLHQLRGRVGRGEYESFCVLLYQSPLSETAQARLKVMRETSDGFKLAEHDLKLRGSGELLGKRQTGSWNLKIADIIRDRQKLPEINKAADYISKYHPDLVLPLVKLWLGENYKLSLV